MNFGTSQNYPILKFILNYLPEFFKKEDLHYSEFTGMKEFKKIIAMNTGYDVNETIPIHSLESAIDIFCHNFKNVYIENKCYFNMKNILSHSKANIVEKEMSECNIFILPDETEIQNIINNIYKYTLIVINNKSQIVHNSNKYIIYAYKLELSENLSCGVIHTTNTHLINRLNSKDLLFYLVSNVIQVAAINNVNLITEHNISDSLVHMFANEKIELSREMIHVINKSSKALDGVAKTVFNKDDLIGVNTPLYPGFVHDLSRNGANMLFMPNDENKTLIDKVKLASEQGAKGFLICNPENPTGKIYEKDEIEEVCMWAEDHKTFNIIFDELYANSCHSESKLFYSALKHANSNENIIVIRGFAKDFGLSGFNLGVVISSNKEIKENFLKWKAIQEPHPATLAVLDELLKKSNFGNDIISMNKVYLKHAINKAKSILDQMGIKYVDPHAGLFIMVDLEEYMKLSKIENEIEVFERLFNEYGLNISPGKLFKYEKNGMFRLCLINSDETIVEGLSRLKKFLKI